MATGTIQKTKESPLMESLGISGTKTLTFTGQAYGMLIANASSEARCGLYLISAANSTATVLIVEIKACSVLSFDTSVGGKVTISRSNATNLTLLWWTDPNHSVT